jgi:hypothetical protein
VLTLTLTIAIGALLTRQQVDRVQVAALCPTGGHDRPVAPGVGQLRQLEHRAGGRVDDRRRLAELAPYVRDVTGRATGRRPSRKQYIYSYRTIPARGCSSALEREVRCLASLPRRSPARALAG